MYWRSPWPLSELLSTYTFWLMDVGPMDGIGLPLFTPLFGFASITAPTVTFGIRTVKEGNWFYPRKLLDGSAVVSPIRMTRGIMFLDSDFYRWVQGALFGDMGVGAVGATLLGGGPTPRRNFVLIHYFPTSPKKSDFTNKSGPIEDMSLNPSQESVDQVLSGVLSAAGIGVVSAGAAVSLDDTPLGATVATILATNIVGTGFSLLNAAQGFPIRIPAKAFLLKGCLPTFYKPASDFDANNSSISLQELEFELEEWEEISLAA